MVPIKQNKFFLALLFFIATLFLSCEKDKDPVNQPPVVDLKVGSSNNKKATVGEDLHLDANITAEALVQRIDIEIHQEGGDFEIEKSYTEGEYIGEQYVYFHEHLDIPSNAPAGNYHLHFTVTDQNGQKTTVESELELLAQSPSAALVFTEVTGGASLYAHGDHFHGLGGTLTDGESKTVTFDAEGNAISGGHLHLEAEAVYRVELKVYDAEGNETQGRYIADKATADQYKAFLVGGNLKLNSESENNEGAIFQPRELKHGDETDVTGSGGTGTVGILSYFIIGHENEDLEADVAFVLRKLSSGVKTTITRNDWNRTDYATVFAGSNELELKFEIHVEHGH